MEELEGRLQCEIFFVWGLMGRDGCVGLKGGRTTKDIGRRVGDMCKIKRERESLLLISCVVVAKRDFALFSTYIKVSCQH